MMNNPHLFPVTFIDFSSLQKSSDAQLSERALDGLRQVMAIKSRAVLPYLIPQLTSPPINTKALAILASVAGDALTKYLHKILPALLKVVASPEGECVSRVQKNEIPFRSGPRSKKCKNVSHAWCRKWSTAKL